MDPDALRQWIEQHDYNVSSLARDLGVSRTTVGRWLSGAVPMPRAMDLALEALARRREED